MPRAAALSNGEKSILAEKLDIGARFPSLDLKLVGGGTLALPDGLDADYKIILFYRGHW